MTNAMWLRAGASMLQMLPYGWNLTANNIHDGRKTSQFKSQQVIRGHLYARMAEMANCSHHYWINEEPKHAFFQGCASAQRLQRVCCKNGSFLALLLSHHSQNTTYIFCCASQHVFNLHSSRC